MPKTSTCPKCEQPITLVEAPQASLVECPHCREQFELAEALDFVAESDEHDSPPELSVIEVREAELPLEDFQSVLAEESPEEVVFEEKWPFDEQGVPEAEGALDEEGVPDEEQPFEDDGVFDGDGLSEEVEPFDEEGVLQLEQPSEDDGVSEEACADEHQDEEGSTEETPEEHPVQVRCPCCGGSFALQDLLLAETDEPLGAAAASAILVDGSIRESEDGPSGIRFSFAGSPDEDHSGFRLESVEERPTASAGPFEFAAPVGAGIDRTESGDTKPARRRRRERGGMKDLLGAMFGGAAGLLITYYLLNLIGGARYDILKVYLPGVKHTTVHRPGWLGGPPEKDEFDSGIGNALGMGEETPEPRQKNPKSNDIEKKKDATSAEAPPETPAADAMPPEAEALPADYVGLISPPQVTSEQLGQAIREVDRLAKAGPLGEEAYEAWCRVAEAATFVDRRDGDPQTQNRLTAMRSLMKKLSVADVTKIGQFATRHAVNPDRASHGILLAGRPRKPNTQKGNGYLTGVVMADTGAQVVVASDHKLPIQPEDRILLLGYLVDQPKETTQGLDTELPQIIWAQDVVKFGE